MPAFPVAARWRAHPMLPALALGLAAFLTNFDVTAVVVAMPAISAALGFGVAGYAWVMDAYSLAFTGALLGAGALADRYGRRLALLGGTGLFALASLACGLAWDGPSLWVARGVQGVGAAFVITGGIALIASTYPDLRARTRAFALLGIVSGTAMAVGPTVGGLIAGWAGWRWIFLANLPLCAVALWGLPRMVAEAREPDARPIDPWGIATLTLALGLAIWSLLHGGAAIIGAGLALSAALVALFVIRQRRQVRPMFDPALFARPVMAAVAALLAAVSVGYWAVLVYLPRFLDASFGWSSEVAGVALLTATLPMLVLPPLGGRLVARWGWRGLFGAGLAAIVLGDGLLVWASMAPTVAMAPVIVALVAIGVGAALVHPQLSGAVIALVPPDQAGTASAITIVLRQGGFAIGIAIFGAALTSDTTASYAWPFGIATAVALGGLVAALTLAKSAPD